MSTSVSSLSPVQLNILRNRWIADVYAALCKGPHFTVGDIVGVDWPPQYDIVYWHWYEQGASNWKNWNVARTQLGRILKSFVPQVNAELGIELKTRTIERHGHSVNEYYVESEVPIFPNPANKLI